MNTNDAIQVLRKHNGELGSMSDTLLGSLRPYTSLQKAHFSDIVKAIYFAAPLLNAQAVERDLVHSIWELTRSARLWTKGPREPMFHGRHFISDDDKQTLDRWLFVIEDMTLDLLRGFEDWEVTTGLACELASYDSILNPDWLVPPFMISLKYQVDMEDENTFDGGDCEALCTAFAKIGPPAMVAVPLLKSVASNTRFPEVTSAAERAITVLTEGV